MSVSLAIWWIGCGDVGLLRNSNVYRSFRVSASIGNELLHTMHDDEIYPCWGERMVERMEREARQFIRVYPTIRGTLEDTRMN